MKESELRTLVSQKIQGLRPKLLDLSRRNPLLSTKLSSRSNANVRIVDELPEVLFYKLNNGQALRFTPLPELDDDPRDENTKEFLDALANARLTDVDYLAALESIERDNDDFLDRSRIFERDLKDRLRVTLGLPLRQRRADVNIVQHARNNGVSPSYDLPGPGEEAEDGRHTDDNIQTLLLPKDLERKLNNVTSRCRTWVQETGINVLHVAYGFLEWSEPNQSETSFAPLVLCGAHVEKKRTREGVEFWVSGSGEDAEVNPVLTEKLRLDFGIDLPQLDGSSVEDYLATIANITPKQMTWRVRRQVVVGVFPSARMAMYRDIDPEQPGFPDNEIVNSLLGGTNSDAALPFADEYDVDQPGIEEKVPCLVLDADSSQFSTLVDVASGRNLAVEGPPGTGKSQTIVNAIAAALAEGKKVLFVAEKLAALNVVRARLEAVGLGEFLLPLQAERSTREQVITSVRERVEMQVPDAVRDYEAQLAAYKRVRADLAEYIDILTSSFGNSGLKVHAVLSKSIATAPLLADLPHELMEQIVIPDKYLNRAGIETLNERAAAVERAFLDTAGCASYWKSTGLTHADRFTVEQACNLARQTSRLFKDLTALRAVLVECHVDPSMDDALLASVKRVLSAGQELASRLPQTLLIDLIETESSAELANFIDQCDLYAASQSELAGVLACEVDEDAARTIERLAELSEQVALSSLDLAKLQKQLTERRERVAKSQALIAAMAPLLALRSDSEHWSFKAIDSAHNAVRAAGRDALLVRNAATSDPAALPLLRRLCSECRSLQEARKALDPKHAQYFAVPVATLIFLAIWASVAGLGALANIVGAGATIAAGILAWVSVQQQREDALIPRRWEHATGAYAIQQYARAELFVEPGRRVIVRRRAALIQWGFAFDYAVDAVLNALMIVATIARLRATCKQRCGDGDKNDSGEGHELLRTYLECGRSESLGLCFARQPVGYTRKLGLRWPRFD